MYLLILFLPLFGFCSAAGAGRYLGSRGAACVTTLCVSLSSLMSFVVFYEVGLCQSPCYIQFSPWFVSEMFDASWGFLFDSLTGVMLVVITFVSTLVHIYSISYMSADPHIPRFMSYLSLFTFFMLMLVTGDNFLQMFFGWEGVGLASYLLINFWFTRLQANKSAIKAMLMNRVGDFGLALGIMGLFSVFQTLQFQPIFACCSQVANTSFLFCGMEFDTLSLVCTLLFVGSVGKSAQLGLHTWLPDAMEGPTPVSALIHAATMVTAGVFLLARCSPLFEYAPQALCIVTFLGATTSFFAATTGVVQNDLKRVIAYSTCSQLGYMVFICGLSHYSVGVFHLMNHAFFKALLFLSAGSVIHALSDEQDMRKFGGIIQLLPLTYSMMLLGSLALIGFPFLTGFYSKDCILEVAYAHYTVSGQFAYWLGTVSAFFTSYYSFRLLFYTFLGETNCNKSSLKQIHEAPFLMAFPFMLLAVGSIFVGYVGKDMMIGGGTDFWGNAVFILPQNILYLESEYIPQSVKMIPLVISMIGALLAAGVTLSKSLSSLTYLFLINSKELRDIYAFLNKRWLFDTVYNSWIGYLSLNFGYHVSLKTIDKGFLEILGPTGIMQSFQGFFQPVRAFQSGFLYHYALMMLIGLTFFVTIFIVWDSYTVWVDTRLFFLSCLSFFLMESSWASHDRA